MFEKSYLFSEKTHTFNLFPLIILLTAKQLVGFYFLRLLQIIY